MLFNKTDTLSQFELHQVLLWLSSSAIGGGHTLLLAFSTWSLNADLCSASLSGRLTTR